MRKHIPNLITLLNLFCGCCATVCILHNQFILAFWLMIVGVTADYLDGLVARMLNVKSILGKELDSLADMVSFGFVPGTIFYVLLLKSMPTLDADVFSFEAAPGFIVTLFACFRLAKFNIDDRQTEHFIGLPTPSATFFTIGLMLIYHYDSFGLRSLMLNPVFLIACILLLSYVMVSELEMFSFKLNSLKWKGNEIKFIFAALSIILLIVLKEVAFSLIILIYLVIAFVQKLTTSKNK